MPILMGILEYKESVFTRYCRYIFKKSLNLHTNLVKIDSGFEKNIYKEKKLMALRKIVTKEDPILRKRCKPVEKFDEKLEQLIDDMIQTLEKAQGVGLAAPQVGFLKRIFVMDFGEGMIECVNPEILKTSGKQRVVEGCLSCPNDWGYVTRPNKCRLKAQNRYGEYFVLNLKELGAQCACHENDHLDGNLFVDKIEERVQPEEVK